MNKKFWILLPYFILITFMGSLAINCAKATNPTGAPPPVNGGLKVYDLTTLNQYIDILLAGGPVKVRLTGGTLPYTITSQPNASFVTASVSNDTLTLTPIALGYSSITIHAASNQTVNIAIIVSVASAFTVTVGSGTTPQYSWAGGNAMYVGVARLSNIALDVWAVLCNGSNNCITPPVTHGTTPTGTTVQVSSELTLTPGIPYRVTVYRPGESGYVDFVP